MGRKNKRTRIELEDRKLIGGPRKPKGGGFHKHKNSKRPKTRKDYKNIKLEDWEDE